MAGNERVVLLGLKRTFVGKRGGALAHVGAHRLMTRSFCATLADVAVPIDAIDDVIVGNVRNSIGNIARVAALDAGVPEEVPACTVDRQCASGLEALAMAAARVRLGEARIILAGGVESASTCPWLFDKTPRGYAYAEPRPHEILLAPRSTGNLPMGQTAEMLAREFAIPRDAQDRFAYESHQKAANAATLKQFDAEICTMDDIAADESVRPQTTLDRLAALRPAFDANGTVTAGNSSPLNDGAASCLVMTESTANELGIVPQAILGPVDTVGLHPNRMGLGPAMTLPRLLKKSGLACCDVDLFEINEAFAAQVLASLHHLRRNDGIDIPAEKLNCRGGAIALGHPLGATGLRLVVTLVHALEQNDLKQGVVSMCVGGGQGMSASVMRY
jgi:acetyl-CoA C-acetyltransferase